MAMGFDHEGVARSELMRWITPYSNEVYLWEGPETPPATLVYDEVLLERFMDRIFVPVPIEALTPEQISLVNALRRTLVLRDELDGANEAVKRFFAAVIEAEGVRDLLEWGCGYTSIEAFVPAPVSICCVDQDPQVVKWQSARGRRCFHTSQALVPASFAAIVAVFVFHFRITTAQVESMAAALHPTGFLLANVYRRDATSRCALRAEFERQDFTVVSLDDPMSLCARHEYWAMSKRRARADLAALLRKQLH